MRGWTATYCRVSPKLCAESVRCGANALRASLTHHASTELRPDQIHKIRHAVKISESDQRVSRIAGTTVGPRNPLARHLWCFQRSSGHSPDSPSVYAPFPWWPAIFMTPLQDMINFQPPFLVMCSITSQRSHRRGFAGRNPSIINGVYGLPKIWATCPPATLYYTGLKMPLTLYHQHDVTWPSLSC